MAGLGQDIKVDGEQYLVGVSAPQNTTVNSSAIKNMPGAQLGSLQVKVVVNTDLVIADTKIMTVKLQHSDAETTGFTDYATLYTVTASGVTTVDAETVLALFVLPTDIKKWTRLTVTTDDAAVTGKVDAYPVYLPR